VTVPRHPDCPFDPAEWNQKIESVLVAMDKRSQYNQWIIGLGVAILMTIGGVVWSGMSNRIQTLENTGSAPMRERASRNEAEVESLKRDIAELKTGQREILQILRAR
jgi:hypothetical protein